MSGDTGRRWPLGIVAVLGLTVVGNAIVYQAANDANAAAVEPDYYRKAVEWDSTLAQSARNQALGWRADAVLGPSPADSGRTVTVRLTDAAGAPLAGAAVELTAIHNTYALHPVHATGSTDADGVARLTAALDHAGRWELRLVISRGADRFTADLHEDTPRETTPP